jgi:hypothetical protein
MPLTLTIDIILLIAAFRTCTMTAPLGEELDWEYPFLLLAFVFLYQSLGFFLDGTRNPPIETQRVNWIEHRDKIISRGHFRRTYRMSPESFEKLVEILRPVLTVNATKAFARSPAGPIIPEIRLHCLIRYIAGGSYLDICTLVSIPHSTFYYSLWKTCAAINASPQLAFRLPSTKEELKAASDGFESISYNGIMRGCIGAIDGWLCAIIVPPKSAVGNVISYFSGHYQRYGLNVQAIVDHLGRFLYIAVAAPGSQPDVNAFKRCGLHDILSRLPLGYFVVGDNAYTPAEYLVPVFGGADRNVADNDNCNFYISQVRIRVEMAFGMMLNKFGILRSPLRISVHHIGPLLQCIAKLHNFMLDENNSSYDGQIREEELLVPPTREDEIGRETNGEIPQPIHGISATRRMLVLRVKEAGLARR